jgi:hypothetical protein
MENPEPKHTLTRYLYSKPEVYQSLIVSLLEHQPQESLYWAYEVYFSGFEEDIVDYVRLLYHEIYETQNKKLLTFVDKTADAWYENKSQHHLLGSLVYTLAIRPYNLDDFMTKYFNAVCLPREQAAPKRPAARLIVCMKPEQINPYYTVTHEKPYKILGIAVKYRIRKYMNALCSAEETPTEIYANTDTWLYYASNSPIWRTRIEEYGGNIDHETQTVNFAHATADDKEPETDFYDEWDYELDEQTTETKRYIYGEQPQINLKEFALRYGVNIIVKTNIKISTISSSTAKPENTIRYSSL